MTDKCIWNSSSGKVTTRHVNNQAQPIALAGSGCNVTARLFFSMCDIIYLRLRVMSLEVTR